MYIDIIENDNLAQACMATFNDRGEKKPLTKVRLWLKQEWQWCAVCGWEDGAPSQAFISLVEESGDGEAMLISGGNQGLRLACIDGPDGLIPDWDLRAASQWAEAFLLYKKGVEVR